MTPLELADDIVRSLATVARHRVPPAVGAEGYEYPDHDQMVRLVADAIVADRERVAAFAGRWVGIAFGQGGDELAAAIRGGGTDLSDAERIGEGRP